MVEQTVLSQLNKLATGNRWQVGGSLPKQVRGRQEDGVRLAVAESRQVSNSNLTVKGHGYGVIGYAKDT
jgi:hypothetical protein